MTVRSSNSPAASGQESLRPDTGLNAGLGTRNGDQFREGLRDRRSIWIAGRRVKDVTREDGFRGGVDTLASLYDLQQSADLRGRMTVVDDDGVTISASYLAPMVRSRAISGRC